MTRKLLALLLAVLTVLPILVSCAEDKTETTDTVGTTAGTVETEDPYDPHVPFTDYKEHEFVIMAPQPDDWGIASYDRQELTSDQVNDAIYTRNRQLESQFNITISALPAGNTGTQASEFQSYAMAGTDVIDMIAVGFYQSGKPLIVADYVLPWNDVEYVNLDKPWWNKSVSQTLSIFGNYYYIVGDTNWFTMPETAVCYFNKNVADTYKENIDAGGRTLYDIVDDNEWTFDRLYDTAKTISSDNGDSSWDDQDTYGCILNTHRVPGFVYSANYQTVYMTDDGPVMNFNSEKMQKIADFLLELAWKNNVSYTDDFDFTYESTGVPIFFDDRALFYFDILIHAESFRGYTTDFGIIPYPKYDLEQKDYVTYANQWGLCCALPCTASDTARTGEILEAMSALSRKLIVPAYYEKTLMGKIKRDDESEPMLDLIFSNVLYDFGLCYCTDLSYNVAMTLVKGKTNALSSWYKAFRKKIESNYKELAAHVYEQKYEETPAWAEVI